MLSWLFLLLVLGVLVALGTWVWGGIFGRGEVADPVREPAEIVESNRRAIGAGKIDEVGFELVARGYRPEQVDDVIAHLCWQLERARAGESSTPAPLEPEKD